MKIGIVSDTHLGYEKFEEDALKQARKALVKAAEVCDVIIISGDVFDRRAPSPRVIADGIKIFREAGNILRKNQKAKIIDRKGKNRKFFTDIPIVVISGTHERTAIGDETAIGLLDLAGVAVDSSEAQTIIEMGNEKVAVYGLGGVSEEKVKEMLKELKPQPIEGMFNIFVFHQSIYEILPFSNDFIHYEDLPAGFDLYIDGHIHNRIETTVYGKPFIIPGSTVLTQLKEGEQESKGFAVYDTISGEHNFVHINSRPFIVKHIKSNGLKPKEIMENCERAIQNILLDQKKDKPIIKLVIEGVLPTGYTSADLLLRLIPKRYEEKALIDIDSSKLESPEIESGMKEIRSGKLGGIPIKDRGLQILKKRLKEYGYSGKVNATTLFEILSSGTGKAKILKAALDELYKKYRSNKQV